MSSACYNLSKTLSDAFFGLTCGRSTFFFVFNEAFFDERIFFIKEDGCTRVVLLFALMEFVAYKANIY